MQITHIDTNTVRYEYSGLIDLKSHITENWDRISDLVTDRPDFRGLTNRAWKQALSDGLPDQVSKFHSISDNLNLNFEGAEQLSTYNDVCGSYVDMGAYVSGVPECMVNFRQEKNNDFLTIYYDPCASWNTPAEKITQKLMYIAKLVDYCENKNIRVRLFCSCNTQASEENGRIEIRVKLKDYYEPVNLSSLLFTSHSAFFRGAILSAINIAYKDGNYPGKAGNSYGIEYIDRSAEGLYIDNMYIDRFPYNANLSNFQQFIDHLQPEAYTF